MLLLVASLTFAQGSHMKFMGIPMDCDTKTFAQKLVKEKGLKRIDFEKGNTVTLKGEFSGYDDCTFFLRDNGGLIDNVGVVFKERSSFASLHAQFNIMKRRLQTKYGEPSTDEETFKDYEPLTDMGKITALQEGNAFFETEFILEEGMIILTMKAVQYTPYLQLIYMDRENSENQHDKTLDDL